MYICKGCKQTKDIGDFPKNAHLYLHPQCKLCKNIYNRELRRSKPEIYKASDARRRAKPGYKEWHTRATLSSRAKKPGHHTAYMRKFRADNPDYVKQSLEKARNNPELQKKKLEYQLQRQRENKEYVNTFKTNPCMDCGNTFPPYVMDFDHVRGKKVGNISSMCNNRPQLTILKEIEKCDLVCSNCHRTRTYNRNKHNAVSG